MSNRGLAAAFICWQRFNRTLRWGLKTIAKEAMIDRTRASRSLPLDVVACILGRLPARSVARFRCVCKEWLSLTCDHRFIDEHRRLGALERRNLVTQRFGKRLLGLYGAMLIELDGVESDGFEYGELSNPVNGLFVAISGCRKPYLFNPLTRDAIQLPVGHVSRPVLGLGFDASSGSYKLVTFEPSEYELCLESCKVLTVGAGGWRCVQLPAAFPLPSYPVFLDGAIYWLAQTLFAPTFYGGLSILIFDVKDENHRFIPTPKGPFDNSTSICLRELEGHVCFVTVTCTDDHMHGWKAHSTRIWRLVGHRDHERWRLEYEIDTSEKEQYFQPRLIDISGGKAILRTAGAFARTISATKLCTSSQIAMNPCLSSREASSRQEA